MSNDVTTDSGKQITAYCDSWSLRAGEPIALMASSHTPCEAQLDLVRIVCGDPTRTGPGFEEHVVASDLPSAVALDHQPLTPGSYASADLTSFDLTQAEEPGSLGLTFGFLSTLPDREATLAAVLDSDGHPLLEVRLVGQTIEVGCGDTVTELRRVVGGRWYSIDVSLADGTLRAVLSTDRSASPGRDLTEPATTEATAQVPSLAGRAATLLFARGAEGRHFDGRIAEPVCVVGGERLTWDLAHDMAGRVIDGGEGTPPLELHQLPARGVTGPTWDGSTQRWTDHPSMWAAVHFHHDDLYDAGWATTASITLPHDLPSGIYAFRLVADGVGEDRVPFFVRPGLGQPTADVALLMSSCTYMAYANHRMLFEGADFIGSRTRLRPEHEYVRTHPELGRSMYEKHPDASGVMYSSRNRPVLQLRPGADGWNFTPDTDINAFLAHLDVGHDVIGDEDVHFDGAAALAPYRLIVTGTHPEYWSTAMLDALEEWQRGGGRLMYLGGNGFYWRVAFSDAWPGAIELRRAEDGVRNWQTESGENYHSFTGEYGGLWRRNNRAPNELVGIGFAAQGFEKATHYERSDDSYTSRAAWIFDGVEDRLIGTSGLGGGAAGQEVDRYDVRLGSPEHAVVLASATEFGPDMLRTKEEFEGSVAFPTPDPYVRADIVFYETPGGGAVFSVGSISWFGALARNEFDNDVATITANVVRRFADPEPFPVPDQT